MSETTETQTGFFVIARRLWKYARRYRLQFLVAVVATVLLNFASLARPHLLKILTDKVLTGSSLEGKTGLLVELLGALLLATFLKGLFTYVQNIQLNLASHGTVRDLREDVYGHLQHLPLRWFDRHRVGDVLVRFTDDLRVTVEFLTSGMSILTNDTLILVTSLAWMITKDWQLTVIAMVISPLAGMTVRRFSKKVKEATNTAQERLSDMSSQIQETVSGIKVVKSFNKEDHEGDRFSRHNEESFRWAMRIVQYTATQSPIVEVLATGGIALVLYYCALKVITGDLTLGDLLAFWAYMLMATTPINRLPQTMQTIQRGCTAVDRILEVRDTPSEEEAQAAAHPGQPVLDAATLGRLRGHIEIRGVRFRYEEGREEALRGVDLEIPAGQHVAILGRNGAGKSTLVNLLPRFYALQEGDIRIDGHSVRELPLGYLRSQIGLVSQDIFLFSGTIRDNLRFGRQDATDDQIAAAARAAGAHHFIMYGCNGQDYNTMLGERGSGLSGGQRQRVALARMLLKDPPIVILDEATSAMDPDAEKAFQESLEIIRQGRTVVNISHRLSTARGADRIVVLEQGRIVEDGTHETLLAKRGHYFDLYTSVYQDGDGEKR